MITISLGSTGEFNTIRNSFLPSINGNDETTTMLVGLMYQNFQSWQGSKSECTSIADELYQMLDTFDDTELERERIREYLYRCCCDEGISYPEGLHNLKNKNNITGIRNRLFTTLEEFLEYGTYEGETLLSEPRGGEYRFYELYKPLDTHIFYTEEDGGDIESIHQLYRAVLSNLIVRLCHLTKELNGKKTIEVPLKFKMTTGDADGIDVALRFGSMGYRLIQAPEGYTFGEDTKYLQGDDTSFIHTILENSIAVENKNEYKVQTQSSFYGLPAQDTGVSEFSFLADLIGAYLCSYMDSDASESDMLLSLSKLSLFKKLHMLLDVPTIVDESRSRCNSCTVSSHPELVNLYHESSKHIYRAIRAYMGSDLITTLQELEYINMHADYSNPTEIEFYIRSYWYNILTQYVTERVPVQFLEKAIYLAPYSINHSQFGFEHVIDHLDTVISELESVDYIRVKSKYIEFIAKVMPQIAEWYAYVSSIFESGLEDGHYESKFYKMNDKYNCFRGVSDLIGSVKEDMIACIESLAGRDIQLLLEHARSGLERVGYYDDYSLANNYNSYYQKIYRFFELHRIIAEAFLDNEDVTSDFEDWLEDDTSNPIALYYFLMYCIEMDDSYHYEVYLPQFLSIDNMDIYDFDEFMDVIRYITDESNELYINESQLVVILKGLYSFYIGSMTEEDWTNIQSLLARIPQVQNTKIMSIAFKYLGFMAIYFDDFELAAAYKSEIDTMLQNSQLYRDTEIYPPNSLYQSIQLREQLETISEEDFLSIYQYLYIAAEQCENHIVELDVEEVSLDELKEAVADAYKYIDN